MYSIGKQPGTGIYCCLECDWRVTLQDPEAELPPCPNCGRRQQVAYVRCEDEGGS